MRIKKFVASSVAAALQQIKVEFGEDAIIIDQKKLVAHPQFGNGIEITAAIEPAKEHPKPPENEFDRLLNEKVNPFGRPAVMIKGKAAPSQQQPKQQALAPGNAQGEEISQLKQELHDLSSRLNGLIDHLKTNTVPAFPKPLQTRLQKLLDVGIEQDIAGSLLEELVLELNGEDLYDAAGLDKKLLGKIRNRLTACGPIRFKRGFPTVVPVVGSTGVGKTTTVAKLAAIYKYQFGKNTGVISADSYRIGAMEQLKSFAELSGVAFESAYEPKEVIAAVKNMAGCDLILIDTPGVNPRDMKRLIELKELLRVSKADEIYLTLALTTRSADLVKAVQAFSVVPLTALVFTKLDETVFYGDLLNLAAQFDIPFAYTSAGQNIPEDISIADRNTLAQLIYKQETANADV